MVYRYNQQACQLSLYRSESQDIESRLKISLSSSQISLQIVAICDRQMYNVNLLQGKLRRTPFSSYLPKTEQEGPAQSSTWGAMCNLANSNFQVKKIT